MNIFSIALYGDTKTSDKIFKFIHSVRCRLFMHTINKWNLHPIEMLGDRLVGNQHKFFNNLICDTPFRRFHRNRNAGIIQCDIGFVKIKIQTSSQISPLMKNICQFFHGQNVFIDIVVFGNQIYRIFFKHIRNIIINHAVSRMDNTLKNIVAYHFSRRVYFHGNRKSQSVHTLIQTAYAIGKSFWQHRNDLIYQINTGPPLQSLLIHRSVLCHIVAYIGYVYS